MSIDPPLPSRRRRPRPRKAAPPPPPKKRIKWYWLGGGIAGLVLLFSILFAGNRPSPSLPAAPAQTAAAPAAMVAQAPGILASIAIEPATAVPGDALRAVVYPDAGSLAGELVYRWYRNDMPVDAASAGNLETDSFARDDVIAVTVSRLVDGTEKESIRSLPVVLRNRAPAFAGSSFGKVVDGSYVNEVQATDPDGDPLTFSLLQAPAEMTIDAATGVITWPLPPGAEGEYVFQVAAFDGTSAALKTMKLSLGGAP